MDIVKKLHKWADFGYGVEASKDMFRAADEIELLREVLRFYANKRNWDQEIRRSSMGEYEASNIELDQGSYARSAINPR